MTVILRPYQTDAKHRTYESWNSGAMNVAIEMPTGAGKTALMADIFKDHNGAACAIAHRQELVSQISLGLARVGVYHNIIAKREVVRFISSYHSSELGKSFFHPQAPLTVAGVDTLGRRDLGSWAHQVTMWAVDECHHVQVGNKWGKAVSMFPNARGFGVTANSTRADGRGLGRHATGLFDDLIKGPSMRMRYL